MSTRSGVRALGLVLLLLASGVHWVARAEAGTAPQWWGETGDSAGFHLRLGVTVTNEEAVPLTNPMAIVDLDWASALKAGGWPTTPRGGKDFVDAMDFDLDSIRVVQMWNFLPQQDGTRDGTLRVVDFARAQNDPARYEVPQLTIPGLLQATNEEPYDATSNPSVTVLFEVPGTLQPGEKRFFMVYADTLTNGVDHDAPDYSAYPGWSRLQSLFWSAPSTELVTVAWAPQGTAATVEVVGLHDGTTVQVLGYKAGQWAPVPPPQGLGTNPTTVDRDMSKRLFLGTTSGTPIRIVADKPVLGMGVGTGFVPAIDTGRMVGGSFLFNQTAGDTIHFMNPGGEPTTVVVQAVAGGPSFTYKMSDSTNPNDFTIGYRSTAKKSANNKCSYGGSSPGDPGRSVNFMPGLFRATVSSGGPVLLQYAPWYGLNQVPDRSGAATGSTFDGAVGYSSVSNNPDGRQGATCGVTTIGGQWYAAGLDAAIGMHVLDGSMQDQQVDPPTGEGMVSWREVPASPELGGRYTASRFDRPLRFEAQGDAVLFAGIDPLAGSPSKRVPPIHGPLGGRDAGRAHASAGQTLVYAPYDNTLVTASLQFSVSGDVTEEHLLLGKGVHVFQDRSESDWLGGIRLAATQPVIAYPLNAPPGTLAGLPMTVDASYEKAEFRGHLVDISSPTGLDPVAGSTTLGKPITYPLLVTNLGRGIGGAILQDDVVLAVSQVPGWKASLDREVLQNVGSAPVEVNLIVEPEDGAAVGSQGVFEVTAQSRANPRMQDSLATYTHIQRSYDLGLWFERVGGRKFMEGVVDEAGNADYRVFLKNEGSVQDDVALRVLGLQDGWQAQVLRSGLAVGGALPLAPGETVELRLRLVPPDGLRTGVVVGILEAQSQSVANAKDVVTARAKLQAPSDLRLEVDDPTVEVSAGQVATIPMRLRNRGLGEAQIHLGVTKDDVPGWGEPAVSTIDPVSGEAVPLSRYTVGPGETVAIQVTVRSPPLAEALATLGLHFTASNLKGADSVEGFLYATVSALHDLDVTAPGAPVRLTGALEQVPVELRISNDGNLQESLTLRAVDQPSGWSVKVPRTILVPRNATQAADLDLEVPRNQPQGSYNVTLELASEDGNVTRFKLPVLVGATAQSNAQIGQAVLKAQPGETVRLAIPLENKGNVPIEVWVEPVPSEPWGLDAIQTPRFRLPSAANVTASIAWAVPGTAGNGVSLHRALLVTTGPSGREVREVTASFDVGRADLAIQDARISQGPAGLLVEGRVVNHGDRVAHAFLVHLLAGFEVVGELEVRELAPGGTAQVRLLLPTQTDAPALQVDATNLVVEADESNNAFSLGPENVQNAPGAGAVWTLLALALLARRRR